MDILKTSHKIVIEQRTLKSDWTPIKEDFNSLDEAQARIDYLRTIAGTELYRIADSTVRVYTY
jgi:hypothetical protein